MPTLEINGREVEVGDEFLSLSPEQQNATVDEIAKSIGMSPKAEMSWGDTAIDAAKSFGTGLEQGAIGLAGMPADIGRFMGNAVGGGIDWLMGASPEQSAQNKAKAEAIMSGAPLAVPTSEQITKKVESVQGPMYQPKTTLGEFANTTGQFAAGAAVGPGGLVRKAALTVVPGVASEAAGQATEGTVLEPYARVGGALAGGLLASTRGNVGTRQMLKNAPTRETVAADTKAAYDAIDKAGIVFDQNSYKSAAMKIKSDLAKKGWDKLQGGQVAPLLNRVDGMLKPRAVSDWTKVDGILKDAKAILRSPADETTKMHVGIIVNRLEDLVKNGKIASKKGNMTRQQINETIDTARELARRNIIARDIEKMKDKSQWYLSGEESGLRNTFKSYGIKNGTKMEDAEEAAFKSVVNREGVLNVAHNVGSRMGGTVMGAAGVYTGQILPAVAGIIGSLAARKFMEVYTKAGVDKALKTVLAGKSEQQRAAVLDAVARAERRAQALITAESARQNVQVPFLTDANGRQYAYPSKTSPGQ